MAGSALSEKQAVLDKEGRLVSLIHSISLEFGGDVVIPDRKPGDRHVLHDVYFSFSQMQAAFNKAKKAGLKVYLSHYREGNSAPLPLVFQHRLEVDGCYHLSYILD